MTIGRKSPSESRHLCPESLGHSGNGRSLEGKTDNNPSRPHEGRDTVPFQALWHYPSGYTGNNFDHTNRNTIPRHFPPGHTNPNRSSEMYPPVPCLHGHRHIQAISAISEISDSLIHPRYSPMGLHSPRRILFFPHRFSPHTPTPPQWANGRASRPAPSSILQTQPYHSRICTRPGAYQ